MRCLRSAAEHDESGEGLSHAVFDHRDYYCVPYRRQGQKVCFDVAKFDAIPIQFDLLIHAALKKKQPITKSTLVAGAISVLAAMFKKGGCRKIGTSKIARTNIWPRDDNFASLVCRQSFASSIHNKNVGPGHRASHWQRRIFFQN